MSVSVLIADDQQLMRAGLRLILERSGDIDVVGEAGTGELALHSSLRLRPDVVLMDVRMPDMDGLEATRRLLTHSANRSRVIVLTTFDLDDYVYAALRYGASGFLLKNAPAPQLVDAGEALLAPTVTRRLIAEFARRLGPATPPAALGELTSREADVLRLVAQGLTNREIAAELVVGEATVKTHVARVLNKLGLHNRVQAVVFAYESGLIKTGG
jgi:DNA-binding NarL/FixJ family response regulator